jgi:GT2 family glycosyltransferase
VRARISSSGTESIGNQLLFDGKGVEVNASPESSIQTAEATLPGWRIASEKAPQLLDCSLVVATYKRPDDLRRLIEHLSELQEVPAEVIVVDSSPERDSENAVLEICQSRAISFELIYVRSPKGLTLQRNIGVDLCSKDFVFFLDDDALPMDGYFVEIRRVFAEDVRGEIGAVGACAVNEMDKPLPRRWRIRRSFRLVPRTEPFIYNDAGTSAPSGLLKRFSGTRDVDLFPGYAFAVRRKIFDSMRFSGFFEGYSYGEDVEMALRIRRRWRVVCCGDSRVMHHPSPAGRPPAFAKGRMEVKNRYFIWKRYSQDASLLNAVRFHLDFLFLFVMDIAWFAARPWKLHYLSHAIGVLSGVVSCAACPPVWDEPTSPMHYRLSANRGLASEVQCQS